MWPTFTPYAVRSGAINSFRWQVSGFSSEHMMTTRSLRAISHSSPASPLLYASRARNRSYTGAPSGEIQLQILDQPQFIGVGGGLLAGAGEGLQQDLLRAIEVSRIHFLPGFRPAGVPRIAFLQPLLQFRLFLFQFFQPLAPIRQGSVFCVQFFQEPFFHRWREAEADIAARDNGLALGLRNVARRASDMRGRRGRALITRHLSLLCKLMNDADYGRNTCYDSDGNSGDFE